MFLIFFLCFLFVSFQENEVVKPEQVRYILQIASNLALYARNAIANHSADHRTTGVLFSPNVNEGVQRLLF